MLPMAFRLIVPPLTSEFLNIFKNSAVCSTIGLLELAAQEHRPGGVKDVVDHDPQKHSDGHGGPEDDANKPRVGDLLHARDGDAEDREHDAGDPDAEGLGGRARRGDNGG